MKVFRFSLYSLLAILLLAALILPGIIGPKVEQTLLQQLSQQPNAESTGYRRGWFRSEALTSLRGKNGETEVHSEIQHGPVLFTESGPRIGAVYSKTRLSGRQLEPTLRSQLEAYYGPITDSPDASPLLIESFVGTNNQIINTIHLLPIARNDSGQQISFAGMALQLETDYLGEQLHGTFNLGEFTRLNNGREALYLAPASGTFSLNPQGTADAKLSLPVLRADADAGPMDLRDVTFTIHSEQQADRALHIKTDLQIPQVQSATPIAAVNQQINLPHTTYDDLHHYLYTLLLTPSDKRNWAVIMQRPLQGQQQLKIESANGPAQVQLDLDWKGMPTGTRRVADKRFHWLNALTGSMNISAAEQALLQSPLIAQATTLRQYGLLQENNGELQMLLQVDDGNLQVNGQPLPADLFLMVLLGQ